MKLTGLSEQYDGGRYVTVEQDGAHVLLSVEATQGSNEGVSVLTPSQARAVSSALKEAASTAEMDAS